MDVSALAPAGFSPAPLVPPRDDALLDGEQLGPGIRRICVDALDAAVAGLTDHSAPDAGVHVARKSLKRARAMIRLVRDPLGHWTYRQENVVLRDTARVVAPVRDGAVLIETLDGLRERYGQALAEGLWDDLGAALTSRHQRARAQVLDDRDTLLSLVTTLRTARRRFAAWPAEAEAADHRSIPDRYGSIARGIHRVYARGRRAMAIAADTRTEEDLHQWRKRVKYLRHQMEALEPVWPELLRATSTELDRLGEILGVEHDLAVLDETVRSEPRLCPDQAARRVLYALIAHDRTVLQRAALGLGERLYAEPPQVFVGRLGAYWEAWRP
ncbi:MAG TPA: CHAD domain-containing protein [Acidimicrobiia bacterium]|nr:CHAD domain-containing protein [Acidimicrobiia bacterium]